MTAWGRAVRSGNANSRIAPSVLMRPTCPAAISTNQIASEVAAIPTGAAPGRKRVDRGVSVDTESSDGVRLVEREPERAVGAGRDHRGHNAALGQGEFGDLSVGGDASDLIGTDRGEPQCVIRADRNPERSAPGRTGKAVASPLVVMCPMVVVTGTGEPEGAVRSGGYLRGAAGSRVQLVQIAAAAGIQTSDLTGVHERDPARRRARWSARTGRTPGNQPKTAESVQAMNGHPPSDLAAYDARS